MKIKDNQQVSQLINSSWLILLAFIIGIFAGFGSIVFRAMIGFIHNLSFNGEFSFLFNANVHPTASVWGLGIILVPVIGAIIVTWLINTFAPEAKGHGVPEVMDAIYYREGKIRPITALVKSIASSISIGTGGSVGREGPIIQIGAAFASTLAQLVKLSPRQCAVLIAAGAAGGIAATFNTPIGGLAFAIELMLVSISAVNVALVAISTVTATIISRIFLGMEPSFFVPHGMTSMHALSPLIIMLFVPFSLLMGASSALFIHSIYWFEDCFDKLFKNPYCRHMCGMLILGILLYVMFRFAGHYYIEGVGYATILDILNNALLNPWFLLLLFALKLLATCLTLGSGASGGVFSPSLFLGAAMGAAFALLAQHLFPGTPIHPSLFAVAGMAAMVAGGTGAVLTAITMTFEQTRDYPDILPIMISVALAYAVRVRITTESIYTLKLFRRGRMLPQGLEAAISSHKRARYIMSDNYEIVSKEDLHDWWVKRPDKKTPPAIIITEKGKVTGVIRQELRYLRADVDLDKLIESNFIIVSANMTWPSILRDMTESKASIILVSKTLRTQTASDIIGVITHYDLVRSSSETAKLLD